MQIRSKLAIALVTGTILAASVVAADKPIATINGVAISQTTADIFLAQGKANGMPDTPEMRNQLRQELINLELMFQAAKQAGFDKKPEVASQVDAATKNLLAQAEASRQAIIVRAYLQEYLQRHPVTDAQLKATYLSYQAKGGNTEYKARHILVKDEATAKTIIAKLDKGAKFEELTPESIDPGSRAKGGDLDWSSPAKFVKPFAEALSRLKKGNYTTIPVKTEFGFHVIKLEDTRPLKTPSFEEMKPMLQKDAETSAVNKMLADLHSRAKIQ